MALIDFLRRFRLGEYAVFDFAVSFLGIYLFSGLLSKLFLKFKIYIPVQSWLFLTLPIGIIVHLLVGSLTPMTKDFINPNGHFILKIFILSLIVLGLRGIKIVGK